ncbi:MAG: mechanosensitive ion channel family protein [Acidimicrobiales bacterium]|nr:mechanosensitive ion channel family protein [Acidimicrobiales bacterium]
MLAQADPAEVARRLEACGEQPGTVCRFVIDRTGSVGMAEAAGWITGPLSQILAVLLGAYVLNRVLRRMIRRFAARVEGSAESGRLGRWRSHTPSIFLSTGEANVRASARAQTIAAVLRSICAGVIWTFALIYILGALGLNLGPIIAGAGVAGVALGFGAQSLVRDFLSGMFMLIEDQFGVGDVVDVGEASGTVEMVTLRVTRLRDQNGTVWHVPNGEIRRVGNKSQQWARAVLDVAVAPTADLEKAAALIAEAAEEVWASDAAKPDVLDRPEVLGIEYLGPDAATIRVHGRTRPGAQWRVSRLLRVRIAEKLTEAGIDLPPSTFVRAGGTAPPSR